MSDLDYWTGKASESKRNDFLYYFESWLMSVRQGSWKLHFSTRENYYDVVTARHALPFFDIRSDTFESYDSTDSNGHLE